jgi:DNA-binding MarR family transcriptional regulator
MHTELDLSDQMLRALRRVMRAVDLHSRQLAQDYGITGPQALVLRECLGSGGLAAGELARRVSLSQATLTDILNRLEQRGLICRSRSLADRRRVVVDVTAAGRVLAETSPPLLQERFVQRFDALPDWEQNLLLSSLQRIAELMDASDLETAPVLSGEPINAAGPPGGERLG